MTVNIQFVNMPKSDFLTDSVTEKLNKLENKYDWIVGAKVYFKKEKEIAGRGSICEIDLSVPGPKLFASSTERNFELATRNTIKDLKTQLNKRKATFKQHL